MPSWGFGGNPCLGSPNEGNGTIRMRSIDADVDRIVSTHLFQPSWWNRDGTSQNWRYDNWRCRGHTTMSWRHEERLNDWCGETWYDERAAEEKQVWIEEKDVTRLSNKLIVNLRDRILSSVPSGVRWIVKSTPLFEWRYCHVSCCVGQVNLKPFSHSCVSSVQGLVAS